MSKVIALCSSAVALLAVCDIVAAGAWDLEEPQSSRDALWALVDEASELVRDLRRAIES